ncbi:Hypothetical_protein [Hexamita inflata]|uniref:Hypothetical_protein n=1 Tax=Hexamita inflata TaxID=28002 RepID=A0AA86P8J1_9EUKA|nr:Hypothetical protein HINF_LOCUS21425 [Hexamita inflata]CAI9933786.1 Hypothetical protein HINF_LOCUS21431 [Hexamita inflata]CAI9933794.1 Hypothetical protein HINF_LOCUS21439 [Hexamita inflata]CAI9933800.1 Hypothetical protein HINF_LOCUS21445 [Hexamita inflata]CAI9933806.1 Hypothetical protein HINF_LOCUS21451 [Hexamita inflata]
MRRHYHTTPPRNLKCSKLPRHSTVAVRSQTFTHHRRHPRKHERTPRRTRERQPSPKPHACRNRDQDDPAPSQPEPREADSAKYQTKAQMSKPEADPGEPGPRD